MDITNSYNKIIKKIHKDLPDDDLYDMINQEEYELSFVARQAIKNGDIEDANSLIQSLIVCNKNPKMRRYIP